MDEAEVRALFAKLATGDRDGFFDGVADDVDWTVTGTHPLAGRYTSKAAFREATFGRLAKVLEGDTALRTEHVLVAGDEAAVELHMRARIKGGGGYDNRYCWIVGFAGGKIVRVRAYLDSVLVARACAAEAG